MTNQETIAEQARLLGMSAERELALKAKLAEALGLLRMAHAMFPPDLGEAKEIEYFLKENQ